jgi:hypothetical protein
MLYFDPMATAFPAASICSASIVAPGVEKCDVETEIGVVGEVCHQTPAAPHPSH